MLSSLHLPDPGHVLHSWQWKWQLPPETDSSTFQMQANAKIKMCMQMDKNWEGKNPEKYENIF